MKKITVLFITILLLMTPTVSTAQNLQDAAGNLGSFQTGGLSGNLPGTIQTMVKAVFFVVGTIFLLLAIYGGIVWVKASGREDEVNRAKKIIIAATIGLVVIFSSYAITNFFMSKTAGG